MRITIFGATGLLGKALMRHRGDHDVIGFGSRDVDIRNWTQVDRAVRETRPDWIILAAAYTDVDGCETNPGLAFGVNSQGARNVAEAARAHRARLLFVSTDYVFDGQQTEPYETGHPRAPRSVYGQSKAEAEERIIEVLPEACIVRTSWLFGVEGKCFPDTILKLAATRKEIDVVNDQRGCPTSADDLSAAIFRLCEKDATGIVHATNQGECSWFEFAREIIRLAGLCTVVNPTTSDKFVRPAKRPAYSVLSPSSLDRYQIAMPLWQDALQRYLQQNSLALHPSLVHKNG